jgi:hypothetical protein
MIQTGWLWGPGRPPLPSPGRRLVAHQDLAATGATQQDSKGHAALRRFAVATLALLGRLPLHVSKDAWRQCRTASRARAGGSEQAPVGPVHSSNEPSPASSVGAFRGVVPGVPPAHGPVVYERVAGDWRQWWPVFEQSAQDRGSWPVVYLARDAHAAYFRPGARDRMWPDPNDEADGRGAVVVPPVDRVTARSPAQMEWPGRWRGARAGWVPGEESSPRGPAFQPQGRWADPNGWARRARPCTFDRCDELGECDGGETLLACVVIAEPVVALLGWWWRRRRTAGT